MSLNAPIVLPVMTVQSRKNIVLLSLSIVLILSIVVLSVISGDLVHGWDQWLILLTGGGSHYQQVAVWEWRLPRVLMALIVGAGLAISGAIFQSLVRNPLGSPDVTGFNTGAYTGVILAIAFFGGMYWQMVIGALAGGIISAVLVYFLAYRDGLNGFRLIIVGVAISAMLSAFNMWLLVAVTLENAMSAALWGAGTLNGITWSQVLPASILIVFLIILSGLMAPRLRLLEMGDDCSAALGVPVQKSRAYLMLLGVCLTAAATAAIGPISFISLAAPQIAKRLTRQHEVSFLASALIGAVLLAGADFIAQHTFSSNTLPVGIVTVCIGGVYLIYLIIRESKSV